MNTTTLELPRTGPRHSFARRSAYDWIFALVTVGGGIYAFSRYGASMDGYEKAILLGALPVGVALGWFWGSMRTLIVWRVFELVNETRRQRLAYCGEDRERAIGPVGLRTFAAQSCSPRQHFGR